MPFIHTRVNRPISSEAEKAMAKQLGLGAPDPGAGHAISVPEGLKPETIQKVMQAAAEGAKPDEATAFLTALRPLLRRDRQEKLDRAIRAVSMMRTAKRLSKTLDL